MERTYELWYRIPDHFWRLLPMRVAHDCLDCDISIALEYRRGGPLGEKVL
jgi:hypothetical protein